MNANVLVAVVAGVLNLILSLLVPCALNRNNLPYVENVNRMFVQHREMLVTSSLLVAVIVYLALLVSPNVDVQLQNLLSLTKGN